MPTMRTDETLPDGKSGGSGVLGEMFDWAKKLRFLSAVRAGYDSNVNSGTSSNAIASEFVNFNGGVNYRFGAPRLNLSANLTGGLTRYQNVSNNNQLQGTMGFGLAVEYRYSPRVVLTFNTSSSYQQQPNFTLAGTANNPQNPYVYSANSFAAAYQWSDLFTTVSRLDYTVNYYLQGNNQQGFTQPGFTESFRYLYRPTTTAVMDYNANLYGYGHQGNSSFGQSLSFGADHIFSPKWFWNFRLGAEFRTFQNSTSGSGTYLGPYVDNNFSWQFGQKSSVSWVAHLSTQPSGQQNVSYSTALRTGLSYTQGIFTKLSLNTGLYYLLTKYPNVPIGPPTADYPLGGSPLSYYQTNLQGNIDLRYQLNRIINLALGYQYLSSSAPSVPSQDYLRGITYLQVQGAF